MSTYATMSGAFPRTESLVKDSWNFDKGLVNAKQLAEAYSRAIGDTIALQERIGLSPISDGLIDWQDAFRPLVETSPSFEVGGVTRLFENNRFYRQPILNAEPTLDWKRLERWFPHARKAGKGPFKAILPSPYWFTRVAKDNVYHDEAKLGHALAKYVNAVARRLQDVGYPVIQFTEAQLFYEPEPDVGFANELLGIAVDGLTVETVANFINGDAAPHPSFLKTVPTTTLGIDFIETLPEKASNRLEGRSILAQVVNAQESHLETATEVQAVVDRIQKRLKPQRLGVTHTWDLEFVPSDVATQKLEVLAAVAGKRKVAT